ncbi:response regulator transcription factor [Cytophagaceae bacterium DM2B3-1]|uniref:Response regulator transcription factor n=1 Tax=Xanthocytophaga flava TaxID=3048013 RepID=A0ABT7CXY1_9BACT|nr:response regulator transcription factor [Xanthocytophaga flavus]MDJ1498631.1 response regulator transcription factor [Xanthocytophaga flavus]
MKKIRVILVDDERSARAELRLALLPHSDFEIIAEASNADEAREQIETLQPDLLFLDIQMPEKSGFDLLESLNRVPLVIFTTAFDQYAVQAFEINALDYLTKPVREERFVKALERIRDRIWTDAMVHQMTTAESTRLTADQQLFVKDGVHYYFIRVGDISLIESLENYSRIYFNSKKTYQKRSLNQWEELLDATLFFRISRTHIVNRSYIKDVHRLPKGKLQLELITGQRLDVSSRQSVKFKKINSL